MLSALARALGRQTPVARGCAGCPDPDYCALTGCSVQQGSIPPVPPPGAMRPAPLPALPAPPPSVPEVPSRPKPEPRLMSDPVPAAAAPAEPQTLPPGVTIDVLTNLGNAHRAAVANAARLRQAAEVAAQEVVSAKARVQEAMAAMKDRLAAFEQEFGQG